MTDSRWCVSGWLSLSITEFSSVYTVSESYLVWEALDTTPEKPFNRSDLFHFFNLIPGESTFSPVCYKSMKVWVNFEIIVVMK